MEGVRQGVQLYIYEYLMNILLTPKPLRNFDLLHLYKIINAIIVSFFKYKKTKLSNLPKVTVEGCHKSLRGSSS